MNVLGRHNDYDLEPSGGIFLEFYGKFPSLFVPNNDLPLKVEAICLRGLEHLKRQMIDKGLAVDEPMELCAFHLPIFGLFQEDKGLWLSPSHEVMPMGTEKVHFHFRIRFVWLDSKLMQLNPGAMHYLYLQCHDDFVNDRLKTLYQSQLEEKQNYVRGMLVIGLVCPQLNCGEKRGGGRLQNIFRHQRSQQQSDPKPASGSSSSNGQVCSNDASRTTEITMLSGAGDGSNHTSSSASAYASASAPTTATAAAPVSSTSDPSKSKLSLGNANESTAQKNFSFCNLKQRLPASLRRAYRKPWEHILLWSSVKDHLPGFITEHQNTAVTDLMASYVRGIISLVPRYGYETYEAYATLEDGRKERVDVRLQFYNSGCRGLYFGQKFKFKLSHVVKMDLKDCEICIHRRVGSDMILTFQSREVTESFVSMMHGWYRLEVNFCYGVCSQLDPDSLRLMNTLHCFGPMSAKTAEEVLVRETDQEAPRFLICQWMCDVENFRVLALLDGKPVHVANVIHRHGHLQVYHPADKEFRNLLEKIPVTSSTDLTVTRALLNFLKEKFNLKSYVQQQQHCTGIMHAFVVEEKWQAEYEQQEEDESLARQPEVFEYDKEKVQILEKLGAGRKTVVEMAVLSHNVEDKKVALKRLSDANEAKYLGHLQASVSKLRKMRSKSFISFIGLMTQGTEPFYTYAMLELAPRGNLETYLKSLETPQHLAITMSVALQVAQAGDFLDRHNVIHGNLRCRNILIMEVNESKNWIKVKVSDPGLVSVFNKEKMNHPYNIERLPWVAVERMETDNEGKHISLAKESIKSEVFSFGTVIWELITQASKKPHQTFNINDEQAGRVMEFYRNGFKLPKQPDYILRQPDDDSQIVTVKATLWDLIRNCHFPEPNLRPTFDKILKDLHGLTALPGSLEVKVEKQGMKLLMSTGAEGEEAEQLLENLYVDANCIELEQRGRLGEGAYGEVKLARFYPPKERDSDMTKQRKGEGEKVAVKLLKKEAVAETDFIKEVKMLLKCKHPNIVEIKAVCLQPKKMMVMEYMEKGSLLSYLRENNTRELQERNRSLYVRICLQVAEGMAYLSSKKIIHRDLAARNVLLSHDLQAKIADFGLSKVTVGDYYKYELSSGKGLPLLWCAPECLLPPLKFSEKSDVWSFGVLMWEIFSGGDDPKKHFNRLPPDQEAFRRLYRKLEDGARLPKPAPCKIVLYKAMENCWRMSVEQRSSFGDLVQFFKKLNEELEQDLGTWN